MRNQLYLIVLFIAGFLMSLCALAQNALDQTQTLQINTHFRYVVGKPSWLLIVRDSQTGLVSPYLFDIHNNDNFWVAFTYGHDYKVTASTLTLNGSCIIKNFCGLENGTLSGQSMVMTLTGALTPDTRYLKCNVLHYSDSKFTIVNKELLS